MSNLSNNDFYAKTDDIFFYEENVKLKQLESMDLSKDDYKDKENINKMIDFYIYYLYHAKKGLKPISRVNFKLFNKDLTYYVEEEKLEKDDINYIEVSKNGLYTESDIYRSKAEFRSLEDSIIYERFIRELDNKFLSTEVVSTDNKDVIKLLVSDGYVKDENNIYDIENAYIKDCEKDITMGDFNVVSNDFRSSKTFDYLSKTFNESSLYSSLNELESFQKDKLLLSMIYKKMNKKFLKRSKIKGLKRRENN